MDQAVTDKETGELGSKSIPKAMVVGSGPAGLLCAIVLANRGFRVEVVERYSDVLVVDSPSFSITYSLDKRSMRSFEFAKLELPSNLFTNCGGNVVYLQDKAGQKVVSPYPPGVNLAFVSRKNLVAWLVNKVDEFGSERIRFLTGWMFDSFDNDGHRAKFVKSKSKVQKESEDSGLEHMYMDDYSLFVGADGVNSKVRSGIVEMELLNPTSNAVKFSFTQKKSKSRFKKLPEIPASLFLDTLQSEHPLTFQGFLGKFSKTSVLCAPLPGDIYSPSIISREQYYFDLKGLSSPTEVETFFKKDYPALHKMYSSMGPHTFETIARARVGTGGASTYCSKLNYGKILLIGDAAHSMVPALGQGCNSAFEDTFVLGQILSKFDSIFHAALNIESILQEFNDQRLVEVRTIVQLSEDPPTPSFAIHKFSLMRSYFRIRVLTLAKRFLPYLIQGPRPFSASLQDVPYSVLKKRVDEDEREAWFVLFVSLFLMFVPVYLTSIIFRLF